MEICNFIISTGVLYTCSLLRCDRAGVRQYGMLTRRCYLVARADHVRILISPDPTIIIRSKFDRPIGASIEFRWTNRASDRSSMDDWKFDGRIERRSEARWTNRSSDRSSMDESFLGSKFDGRIVPQIEVRWTTRSSMGESNLGSKFDGRIVPRIEVRWTTRSSMGIPAQR